VSERAARLQRVFCSYAVWNGWRMRCVSLQVDAAEFADLAHDSGVKAFPTLVLFPAGPPPKSPEIYTGDAGASAILEWLNGVS